jgi:hypothetical protein
MNKIVKKRFDIDITSSNQTLSKTFDLDKDITSIKGVLITSDRDDLLYYRGSQRIEISKEEFFPENYESKLLMSGISVSPRERYYDLGNVNPGNRSIRVDYKDLQHALAPFTPYRVSYYFDCIKE